MSVGEGTGAPGRWLVLHVSTWLIPSHGQLWARGPSRAWSLTSQLLFMKMERKRGGGVELPLINCWGQTVCERFF